MIIVKATTVKVYELVVRETSLGLFRFRSEWNDMVELVGMDGQGVIIADNGASNTEWVGGLFQEIFVGEKTASMRLVKASPDLLRKIGQEGVTA